MFALALSAAAAESTGIHKCVLPQAVTYQDMPCRAAEGSDEFATMSNLGAGGVSDARGRTPPECEPGLAPAGSRLWPRRTLCLGISDDEVLNIPGWGRPNR